MKKKNKLTPAEIAMQAEAIEAAEIQKAFEQGTNTLRDLISPSSIEIHSDYFRLGTKYGRTLYVYGYPRTLYTGWISSIINIDEVVDVSMYVEPVESAVVMKNQSQFHPLKYLTALIPTLIDAGIKIYEHTTAAKVEDEGSKHVIHTTSGQTITCKYVLTASHYPFNDEIGLYFTRMHPERSYVLGIKTDEDYPGGMYLKA